MSKRNYIIPIFIPHMGCNNDCIFCNQRFITKNIKPMTLEDVDLNIRANLNFLKDKDNIDVAFYGGSFTGIDRKQMIAYLDLVNTYIRDGKIRNIRLSTRADYIDREILEILKEKKVDTIELGVQSMVQEVLDSNHRGHKIEDTIDASRLIKEYGFKLGLQMMVGMYGSDREKDLYTAEEIKGLGPDFVRIYPTLVLPDTYLMTLYKKGAFEPLSLDECIETLGPIVKVFEEKNIPIARIGLPDEIKEDGDLIGPRHPSLRELVYSKIFFEIIEKRLKEMDDLIGLRVYASNKNLAFAAGYKAENKKKLIEKFGIREISFIYKDIDGLELESETESISLPRSEYLREIVNRNELKKY